MLTMMFPGQGAQQLKMLDGLKQLAEFGAYRDAIHDLAGVDILSIADNGDLLHQNLYSSLLTATVSSLSLGIFLERASLRPTFLAGYSVGQWVALYAAQMISFEQLITVIARRAELMDQCAQTKPGAMLSVIGLAGQVVEELLIELRRDGHDVFISNYNCMGQYSVAGTMEAIERAEDRMRPLNPKKLVRLPVSGSWHCPILREAEAGFSDYLTKLKFQQRKLRIVDNVTGDWLPQEEVELKKALARHLSHPVLWERGIKTLIAAGCKEFVEVGFGNTLSKFGFFIDRQAKFSSFYN